MEFYLNVWVGFWFVAFSSILIKGSPLFKRLQPLMEPDLFSPLNTTVAANQRPTDPYEYRVWGLPLMVEYFDYREGEMGVKQCLDTATYDLNRRLRQHPALRNTLMGPTERDFSSLHYPGSYLYLHPGESMTWNHWLETISNIRNVVGAPEKNLNGVGFYFKINVDGIGRVGYGNFTRNLVLW